MPSNIMMAFCVQLFFCFLLVSAQKSHGDRAPRLKPGKLAFSTRVVRSKAGGKARVSLSLSGTESVVLELEPNDELLSPDYEEFSITSAGQRTSLRTKKNMAPCWYKGRVAGDPDSQVLATDCHGFEGLIQRGDGKSFVAKSLDDRDSVAVYPKEDEEVVPGGCGVHGDDEHHEEHQDEHHDEVHSESLPLGGFAIPPPSSRRLLDYSTAVNVVEVALFNDYGYIQNLGGAYGRNLTAIAERNIQIMAIVRATYEATVFTRPTTVKLKAQYFFTAGDPYSVAIDQNGEVVSNDLLSQFRNFTLSLPNYSSLYDHIHLMTFYNFQGNTIGFAYVSAACGTYMQGMTMMSMSIGQAGNVVAHEIGHSLGMSHDGLIGPPDTRACPGSGFMMAANQSCPAGSLCPISSCSISAKNTYTNTVNCLYNWTNPTCNDGLWNGNETGVDCGGQCAPCGATGCQVNNGGCSDICTPLDGTSYVCSCSDPNSYVDPVGGRACIQDINQCLDHVCEDTCVNSIGPGNSYTCSCTLPKQLSLFDGVSCLSPSCFDRRKNQNEVMIDCGGVCARSCACFQSTAGFLYPADRDVNLNGARWLTWDNTNQYGMYFGGVPVRYLYQASASQWIYDNDLASNSYWGTAFQTSSTPYSGSSWQMWNGSNFVFNSLTFQTCASVASTCGNGVVEGAEICDSCLNFTGGVCIQQNPCCDSTCTSPAIRGTQCGVDNLRGACWDGTCVTRGVSCDIITGTSGCFGSGCINFSGGQNCAGVVDPISYPNTTCTQQFYCYRPDCTSSNLLSTPAVGPSKGFPCSSPDSNGIYPMVCDGGSDGTGVFGSNCVAVSSLTDFLTMAPTQPTAQPSRHPTTQSPTTLSPTTRSPTTHSPTTNSPTTSPTTHSPTTTSPTTDSPTTAAPTTGLPTSSPTTSTPTPPTTLAPTTIAPSLAPSRAPTTRGPAAISVARDFQPFMFLSLLACMLA